MNPSAQPLTPPKTPPPPEPRLLSESGALKSPEWKNKFKVWDTSAANWEDIPYGQPLMDEEMGWFTERGVSFEDEIGSGGYGTVWLVKTTRLIRDEQGKYIDKELACKVISLSSFKPDDPEDKDFGEAVRELLSEAEIQHQLDHPNLVKCEEVLYLPDQATGLPMLRTLLFMELCDGTLADLMNTYQDSRCTEEDAFAWFSQVCEGLKYLHEQNVCHFDINIRNVMFVRKDSTYEVGSYQFKLGDFGLSHRFIKGSDPEHTKQVGTPRYMPPEMQLLARDVIDTYPARPADIYCLGRALAESIAGCGRENRLLKDIENGWDGRASKEWGIGESCAQLIEEMCETNSNQRPTIEQIMQDNWFQRLTAT